MGIQASSCGKRTIINTISDGLVGRWMLCDATSVRDLSGNHNTGTVTGAVLAPSPFGQGLSFDGVDDNVDIPLNGSLNFTGGWSVSLWYNRQGNGNTVSERLIDCRGSSSNGLSIVHYRTDPSIVIYLNSGSDNPGLILPTVSNGVWIHLCVCSDGTTQTWFYVNGILKANPQNARPITTPTMNWEIADANDIARNFRGYLDDVRIYNRALTATEILKIYNGEG